MASGSAGPKSDLARVGGTLDRDSKRVEKGGIIAIVVVIIILVVLALVFRGLIEKASSSVSTETKTIVSKAFSSVHDASSSATKPFTSITNSSNSSSL